MKLREMYAFTYEGGLGSWHVKRKGEVYASRPINPKAEQ